MANWQKDTISFVNVCPYDNDKILSAHVKKPSVHVSIRIIKYVHMHLGECTRAYVWARYRVLQLSQHIILIDKMTN